MSDSGSEGDQLGSSPPNDTAAAVMQNPQLLAALQGGLSRLIGQQSGYIQSLPKAVKRRLKALKNIQVEYCKVEGEFYERVHALECEFAERFKPLFEKRKNIVNGQYEPTDEESHWLSDEEEEGGEDKEQKDEEDVSQLSDKTLSSRQGEVKEKVKIDEEEKLETTEIPDDVKGIPEFWLTAMKNVDMLAEMIQEHDEPILKHLLDIRVVFTGPDSNVDTTQYPQPTPMGFVLEYHFSPNPFFTNSVLTKSYKMKCEPDDDDPFSFEGPEIVSTSGCHIDWKKGKNVTQKVVKKKQKKKGSAGKQTRFVSKTIKNDSFFNFFAPPEVPEDEADMDEETEALLSADFEIGHFFRERIIPKAVLYFTGEALEEEFEEEEEESEAEEGDGEEDEDEDPDYQPPPDGEKPPECKNQ